MKKALLITLTTLVVSLLGGYGLAQADGGISFGIRPTQAYADRPETFAYFSHELAAGSILTDAVLVLNSGSEPVTLKLYAADGITAVNGSTAFVQRDQEKSGVSRWLTLSADEVSLEPGEDRAVPCTIIVPSDASPGEHVAGLVVESAPGETAQPGKEGGQEAAQFAVRVIRRAAVAVVITVPGPRFVGLELVDVGLAQQGDDGVASFVVQVRNTGNVMVRGEGFLLVQDRKGMELPTIPMTLGTVLPGDEAFFYVQHPVHLADGNYLLGATLRYRAVGGDEEEGQAAALEVVELKVKEGQPAEPKVAATAPAQPEVITLVGTSDAPALPYAVYGAALLALALLATAMIAWRKRRTG